MTHVDNIPHILEFGITHRNSENANPNYVSIGDRSLIDNRNSKKVNFDTESIILGDFIPFYFGFRTPMLYVIQKGGNLVPRKIAPDSIIYCVTSLQKMLDSSVDFYFTDGHATNNFTKFYKNEILFEIDKLIDFQAINNKYWIDENDLDLKRRKEAEFLVKNDLPKDAIIGFVCFNESAKNRLLEIGVDSSLIVIKPNYYF
jgi:hypothetical protein